MGAETALSIEAGDLNAAKTVRTGNGMFPVRAGAPFIGELARFRGLPDHGTVVSPTSRRPAIRATREWLLSWHPLCGSMV